jgi:hypothetical protein
MEAALEAAMQPSNRGLAGRFGLLVFACGHLEAFAFKRAFTGDLARKLPAAEFRARIANAYGSSDCCRSR